MNDPKPENENTEETLAQRSARLEAEAAAGLYAVPNAAAEAPNAGQSAELQTKIKTLEAELEKTKDQMLRALADAENSRKRAQKEREDASKFAISNFAKDLITVADNFRRALDSIPADAAAADARVKSLMDGIEATERTLLKTFEQHGIRKIVPDNEAFNPNYHDVMFEAPAPASPLALWFRSLRPVTCSTTASCAPPAWPWPRTKAKAAASPAAESTHRHNSALFPVFVVWHA